MFDDDAARRALSTLADDQAPPVTTTLDQVVRRGRRRLFVQRASAVAGVVAVVAAIGVGTILLRSGGPGDGVRVATSPTGAPTSAAMAGWTPVPLPSGTTQGAGDNCLQPFVQLPPESGTPLEPQARVRDAYVEAAKAVLGNVAMADSAEWLPNSPRNKPHGYINLAVAKDDGTGLLVLETARFGGTPEQVANASITVYGNCGEPLRHTLDDGTVMQLYPLDDRDQKGPSQHLQIYRPGGLMYILTSAGWSPTDLTPPDGQDRTVGHGTVPVTEAQLVHIGRQLLTNLG